MLCVLACAQLESAFHGGGLRAYVQLRSYTLLRQPEPTLHIHKMFGYASSAGADRHETRLIDSRLLGRWEEEQGGQGVSLSDLDCRLRLLMAFCHSLSRSPGVSR